MEIELSPHLWFKSLNPGIKGSRDGYQKHKSKRIRRINIIEMHNLGIAMKYLSYQISQSDDYDDHQEMSRWTLLKVMMNSEIGSSGTT